MTRWLTLWLAMLLAPLALAVDETSQSVDESGPAVIEGAVPGTPPAPEDLDTVTRSVALGLRCPVCQGLSVADSNASAAVIMYGRIRELVAAGYSKADIEDYFVSKYGERVLLNPRSDGLNRIVWLGPLLAFGLGLGAASMFLRRGGEDVGLADPPAPPPPDDPYARQLLAEVDDD